MADMLSGLIPDGILTPAKYYPLGAAVIYYVFMFGFAELIRREVEKTRLPKKYPELTRLIFEFIATLQMCSCVYENGVILKNYGVLGFFVVVSLLLISGGSWNRGALVNPIPVLEEVYHDKISVIFASALVLIQFLAASLSFVVAETIWNLTYNYVDDHRFFFHNLPCEFRYHVPFIGVIAYEFVGAFLLRYLGARLGSRKRYTMPFIVSLMLSIAFVYIGVPALNPVTTTARMFNCKGLNDQWFFFTYLFVPIFGHFTAKGFDPLPQTESTEKQKKKNKKQYWQPKSGAKASGKKNQ